MARVQHTSPSSHQLFVRPIALSLLSGVLLGCTFPPVGITWFAWVGLVPLLWAISRTETRRRAFVLGYLAGFTFFLITLHPLVSAHTWGGWIQETRAAMAGRLTRQWWFMHGIWLGFSLWCALFWAAWSAGMRVWGRGRWSALVAGTALWILLPEWGRARTTFGFEWAFLGNACAEWPAIRQVASVGGVAALTALVMLVNFGIAALLTMPRRQRGWWVVPLFAFDCVGLAWAGGTLALDRFAAPPVGIPVALVQYSQDAVGPDYNDLGFIRGYVPMIQQAIARGAKLIVLPETVMRGAVTLDGTPSNNRPPSVTYARASWDAMMGTLLRDTPAVLVAGLTTVVGGRDHNTMMAWSAAGSVGAYHKRRLVPFSEYHPGGWGRWAIRGPALETPGQGSQLLHFQGLTVGAFICQEVLYGRLIRHSVRDGATILVSGGNDGVFGNSAVARVHADLAQLRAVETRRYLIRAMKSGISAIIDPTGREVARGPWNTTAVLSGSVRPRTDVSLYVRWGDWLVWLAALSVAALAVRARAKRRRPRRRQASQR